MKNKIFHAIRSSMKYSFYGILLQCTLINFLLASETSAQEVKSVKEVFITVNLKGIFLIDAFNAIEAKSDFTFNYSHVDINPEAVLTKNYDNASIAKILMDISRAAKLKFRQVNKNININKVTAKKGVPRIEIVLQESVVSGKVVGENGEGVPGVSVVLKGTSTGAITDLDGNYRISIPEDMENATLVFSSVGYKTQEILVSEQPTIDVQMEEDIAELDEVVVVGYGTQQKKEITSAVTRVSEEDFNQGNVNNPQQLLQGKVAGLSIGKPGGDPNQGFTVRLRGLTTLGANSEPLIVVDGIVGGSLNLIDPNDIATIDVLKDASAAAIYGTRGSSGVIIITTKSGTSSQPTLNYNGYVSAEEVANVIDIASPEKFIELGGQDLGYRTDWIDEVTQTALSHVHNISFSNNSGSLNYRASVNYRDVQGVLDGTGFEQLNSRINLSQRLINDKLNLTAIFAFTNRDANIGFSQALRYALNFNPTAPIYIENDPEQGFYEAVVQDVFNPVAINALNTNLSRQKSLLGNLKAEYELLEGLIVAGSYSWQTTSNLTGEYANSQALFGGRARNGVASRFYQDDTNELFELTGTYKKELNRINFSFLGGYSYQELGFQNFYAQNSDFVSDEFTFNNLEAGLGVSDPDGLRAIASQREENKLISFFGRVNLNFSDTYYFSASLRREGSSKFGSNNRWGNFWAVSGGANISQIVNISFIDDLKVRAGYGITGNPPVQNYAYLETLGAGGSLGYLNGTYIPNIAPLSNPNPDLKWEEKGEFNIGLDFSLLDFRLNGTLDYYIRNTSDLLNTISVPSPPNRFGSSLVNIGELETKGFEAQLNFIALDNDNFEWEISGNFSTFKTELIKFNELENASLLRGNIGAPGLNNTFIIRLAEGEEIGQILAPRFSRYNESGEAVLLDKDGNETTARNTEDFVVVGTGIPDFNIGFNNSISYKSFDLNFFFRGSFGHSLANIQRAYFEHPNNVGLGNIVVTEKFNELDQGTDAWHEGYIEKASFIKLDNASLGYTFNLPSGSLFRNIRLYLTGQNLVTITDYTGSDPEARYFDPGPTTEGNRQNQYEGDILAPGIDRRVTYFPTRTYTLGVNVSF